MKVRKDYIIAIVDPGSYTLPYDYFYIKELSNLGYKVDFFCSKTLYNNSFLEAIKSINNVRVFQYYISGSVANKTRALLSYVKMLKDIYKLSKNYLTVHFFWSIFFPLEFFFFLKIKDKFIFTFHNSVPHECKKRVYLPYKVIFFLAKKVLFVSAHTMKEFIDNYDISDQRKIYLVPHGLLSICPDEHEYEKYEIPKVLKKKIIFWGNVKEYKGLDIFLEIINDTFLKGFTFEIYGKWSKTLFSLKNKLENFPNIKIIDAFLSSKEVKNIMIDNHNAIFILPYKKASQSGVMYTLLNYNKIFISSNCGDPALFLRENELEHLIFERNNIASLKASISFVLSNYPIIYKKLYEIKHKYSWNNCMKNIHDVYNF